MSFTQLENADRAHRFDCLLGYYEKLGGDPDSPADVVADLMHYCRSQGHGPNLFTTILEMAEIYFNCEVDEEEEEEEDDMTKRPVTGEGCPPQQEVRWHVTGDFVEAANPTITQRFEEFHRAHPYLYKLFLHYTIEAGEAGWTHCSINAIFERVRWHLHIEIKEGRGFKLNNNLRSRYARLLNEDPEVIRHCGTNFFRIRRLSTL